VKRSNGGVAREIAIAGAGGLVTTACTTAVAWLSPRAQEYLTGPSLFLMWEVYAVFVVALILGSMLGLIIGYHKGQVSVEPETPTPAPQAKPVASFPTPFEPTPLQILCIRALRIADNRYQSLEAISSLLARAGTATPLSDIEQSLEGLIDQSWVSNTIDPSKGVWEYRLIGKGTAFARDRGFPVSGM
jgi:hypothetical protein